jgi:hypothetical protein
MSTFADNLSQLPAIDGIAALTLHAGDAIVARIANQPGQAGSLRLYNALWQQHGEINAAAAQQGLDLYAEHTADAIANPGKHPNIDRLLDIKTSHQALQVSLEKA